VAALLALKPDDYFQNVWGDDLVETSRCFEFMLRPKFAQCSPDKPVEQFLRHNCATPSCI